MAMPILTTKPFIPSLRSKIVQRPNLIQRLNYGLQCKLTLISASAGFGKEQNPSFYAASLAKLPSLQKTP